MTECWAEKPEYRPSFTMIKNLLDELLGGKPDDYLDCGDPEADFVPNINSDDNKDQDIDKLFRYSFLGRPEAGSMFVQGYDRIADAHSAYSTLNMGSLPPPDGFDPTVALMNEIKSNPIPDTYQHLPVSNPDKTLPPDNLQRKQSAQYINHETGQIPIILNEDFRCKTENFVAQKL